MFARFKGFRTRLKANGQQQQQLLTVENSGLTPQQQETARNALKVLGLAERAGCLTKQDCVVFLYAMGLNPTDDIIDSKIRSFKLHQRTELTFGHLAHIWYSMLQDLTDEEEILKRAFQFFDKDGNGEISVQELRTTMHELGDLLSEEEIRAFMEIMDVNNDGVIGYNEFLDTLKTQTPELAGNSRRARDDATKSPFGLSRAGAVRREPGLAPALPTIMPDPSDASAPPSSDRRQRQEQQQQPHQQPQRSGSAQTASVLPTKAADPDDPDEEGEDSDEPAPPPSSRSHKANDSHNPSRANSTNELQRLAGAALQRPLSATQPPQSAGSHDAAASGGSGSHLRAPSTLDQSTDEEPSPPAAARARAAPVSAEQSQDPVS